MKASDNAYPSILITEGTEPAAPAAGKQRLYIDSTTHKLKRTDSSGVDVTIEGVADQGTITYLDFTTAAAPASPSAGAIRVYSKTGDTLAQKTSGGTETVFGAGGGGGTVGIPWIDSSTNPDKAPGSPNAEDDEFDAGSLDAKWTNVNSVATTFGGSRMSWTIGTSGTDALFRQAYVPGAGVAFTITAKFTGIVFVEGTDYCGLQVLDGSNSAIAGFDLRWTTTPIWNRDNPGGAATQGIGNFPTDFYIRISRDASNNYTGSFSYDGLTYVTPFASTSSSTTVAKIAFRQGQTQSKTWKRGAIDWFRRT